MEKYRIIIGVLLALIWMGVGTAWAGNAGATATTTSSCSSSCPSTCDAQHHFETIAKESLALGQPPNPQKSFKQGCLSNLEGFNLNSNFSLPSLSSILQKLAKKIMDKACSTLTSTMNNEVSQGNSILNFALNPKQLEQNALNGVTGTVLTAEQNALNKATGTATNSVSSYVSDAGNAQNTVTNATGNALSGNWVNNLY